MLAHSTNLGETLGALLGVCDLTGDIHGSPSAELRAALAGLAVEYYSPFQSL